MPDSFLPEWTQWVLFLVQVGTLIALVVYVVKTWQMASATSRAAGASADAAREMRRAREFAGAPRIAVFFRTIDAQLAYIVVQNRGESAAENLTMAFDPPLQSSFGQESVEFFDVPKVLAPDSELAHGFDVWHQYFNEDYPLRYTVRLRYRRADTGDVVEESQLLDAAGIKNLHSFGTKTLHDVAKALEKQNGLLDKLAKAYEARTRVVREQHALSASTLSLPEEIAVIDAVWRLFRHHNAAPGVDPDRASFLGELRRHTISALAKARSSDAAQLETALQELHAAVCDRRFVSFENRREVAELVEQKVEDVRVASRDG